MKYSYVLLIFISSFIYGQPSYTDMLRSNLDASLYPQFVAVQSGAWHHGTTWEGGVVPSDNASVKIPNGVQVRISTELATRHKFIHVDGNLFISIHDNTP